MEEQRKETALGSHRNVAGEESSWRLLIVNNKRCRVFDCHFTTCELRDPGTSIYRLTSELVITESPALVWMFTSPPAAMVNGQQDSSTSRGSPLSRHLPDDYSMVRWLQLQLATPNFAFSISCLTAA